jgi:hypothetical protein
MFLGKAVCIHSSKRSCGTLKTVGRQNASQTNVQVLIILNAIFELEHFRMRRGNQRIWWCKVGDKSYWAYDIFSYIILQPNTGACNPSHRPKFYGAACIMLCVSPEVSACLNTFQVLKPHICDGFLMLTG